MRPRQNLKDYHHNSQPPYQAMNHNPNILQQQLQQSLVPPHQPVNNPPLLGPPLAAGGGPIPRVIPPQLPTPDILSELIKLGLNPEEVAKQSNRPDNRRDDVFKNLQAMLGKREAAELLQKLPPLNDLFMQSLTSVDFPRGGGSNSGSTNPRDSVICGPSGIVSSGGGGASGPASFTNSINNGNSGKQEQDTQFSSAQHQANHHQHYRIPTTNTTTTVHSSPQQQPQQQHKSVLSIHQQQQHHQHDPTNRRLNHQQHSMCSAPGSSYTNLSDISRASQPTSSTSDSHNPNIFSRSKTSPPLNNYTRTSGSAQRTSNLMDALGAGGSSGGGGHPGQLENLYDNNAFQQHNLSPSNHQQSLIRHQQLQRLLRASASGATKNPVPSPTSNMSTRNDPQTNQRHGNNVNNMSQMQRQLTSPNTSSAISPPQQALSSVPKSLLNLAACTSKSPPVANNISSVGKNPRVFPQTNYGNNGSNNPVPNNRTATPRQGGNGNGSFNNSGNRTPGTVDPSNLLQQMIARSNQVKNTNNSPNRTNLNNNTLTSLLSDDQKAPRNPVNNQQVNNPNRTQQNQHVLKRPNQPLDDVHTVQTTNAKSKEAYLAYLQERAAKAGISIGEINRASYSNIVASQASSQGGSIDNLTIGQARENLSSQISDGKSTEARNDLSLLYPPIALATSSQRQVNVLAAGLESGKISDVTEEVRRMVQDECNIIYECKACSNLFRSLANLVKHKRQFCDNSTNERADAESNRFFMNMTTSEGPTSRTVNINELSSSNSRATLGVDSRSAAIMDARRPEHLNASVSIGSQKYNLRGRRIDPVTEAAGDSKSTRVTRSLDRREQMPTNDPNYNTISGLPPQQTNLSRLLRSQPMSRQLPPAKDSALMDALNMPNPANSRRSVANNSPRSCSMNELNEMLVKNSSLAKTLLNDVRSLNPSNPALSSNKPEALKSKTAPKRKLLEDCIQKVKRDKLVTDEDGGNEEVPASSQGILDHSSLRSTQMNRKQADDINQFKDPLAIDDSGTDSDALVMDLDEPNSRPRSRRKAMRDARSEEARMQVGPSSSKLNSSSALLKALTRPVESRPIYIGNPARQADDKQSVGSASSTEAQDVTSVAAEAGDEDRSTGTLESSVEDGNAAGGNHDLEPEQELEIIPPSPLFDKYTCEICNTDLADQATLLAHIVEQHKKERKVYPCLFCSFTFITLENVCRHIIDMHKKTKTQVGHLKEVVRSRSFISQDFGACSDCPATSPSPSVIDTVDGDHSDQVGTIKPESVDTRRSSSALSDSAATKQILEDTLALVSSPEAKTRASSNRLAAILSRARNAERSRATRSTESTGVDGAPVHGASNEDGEDPLCDSLLNNITEHLAILESQEAEIEAEKLKRLKRASMVEDREADGQQEADQTEPATLKKESVEAESVVPEDAASEASVEFRNQQTTPSRGKHIVAGQPFENEPNSDQDEEEGEDEELEFECDAPNEGSHGDINEAEGSQHGAASDESTCGQENEGSENDESEPDSPDSDPSNSESMDNEEQERDYRKGEEEYCEEEDEEEDDAEEDDDLRPTRTTSKRVHKKQRRSSRNNEESADDDDDENDDDDDEDEEEDDDEEDDDDDDEADKGDHTDLNSSQPSDKSAAQNFHEVALSRESSSHSSRTSSKLSTMEGGGCKLKVKSSVLRDACGGGSGSATSGTPQASGSSLVEGTSGGGGIKKLKIQLKAQSDEKSKVYRIVN